MSYYVNSSREENKARLMNGNKWKCKCCKNSNILLEFKDFGNNFAKDLCPVCSQCFKLIRQLQKLTNANIFKCTKEIRRILLQNPLLEKLDKNLPEIEDSIKKLFIEKKEIKSKRRKKYLSRIFPSKMLPNRKYF